MKELTTRSDREKAINNFDNFIILNINKVDYHYIEYIAKISERFSMLHCTYEYITATGKFAGDEPHTFFLTNNFIKRSSELPEYKGFPKVDIKRLYYWILTGKDIKLETRK